MVKREMWQKEIIMNWLEKHRKKIEDMKIPETILTVSMGEIQILKSKFRGNKDVKEIRLPQTVLYIDKAAFRDCISLEKINLPPNVCYIHEETFKGCIAIREILAQNPIPPKCVVDVNSHLFDEVLDAVFTPTTSSNLRKRDGKFFEGVDKKKCIIHVPVGSMELYKEAKEWKEFENIVEI